MAAVVLGVVCATIAGLALTCGYSTASALPISATVGGRYFGATVFGSTFVSHADCFTEANGHVCFRPTHVQVTKRRATVLATVRLVVQNTSAQTIDFPLTPTNTFVEVYLSNCGGICINTYGGARVGVGSNCSRERGHSVVAPRFNRRTYCLVVGSFGDGYVGNGVEAVTMLRVAGVAQWATHLGVQISDPPEPDCASADSSDCPIVDSYPIPTPALGSLQAFSSSSCLDGGLVVECGSVIVKATEFAQLAGTPIPVRSIRTVPATPGSQCTKQLVGTYWCARESIGISNGPIRVVLRLVNTSIDPQRFIVEDPYVDVQFACSTTGCSTFRAPSESSGRCARLRLNLGPRAKAALCMTFNVPAGSRIMALGYVEVSERTGGKESATIDPWRPLAGVERFGNVPLSYAPA